MIHLLVAAIALGGLGASPQATSQASEEAAGTERIDQLDAESIGQALIALTLRSDLSPYDTVRFELKTRGTTLIVSLSKTLAGGYDELNDVGLMPGHELPRLIEALAECGVDDIADTASADAALSYELEVRLDGFERTTGWSAREGAPGTPGWCAARLVMDTYYAFGEPVPFRNRFWDDGEYGELNVDSSPPAQLFIDGNDTGLETPVFGYQLAPGVHELRFINEGRAIDRSYEVTIELDLTTQLEVELR